MPTVYDCREPRGGWAGAAGSRGVTIGSWPGERGKQRGQGVALTSNDEWALEVQRRLGAVMLEAALPVGAEIVEPQAVGLRVDDLQQAVLEFGELRRIELALEDRVLHALAAVQAGPGDLAQALAA